MARILVSALLALTFSNAALAGKVTIRWHGQSFFEIESSKGTKIVTDPHAIEAFGRPVVNADIILISHEHDDHNQVGVIRNAAKARVIHGLKGMGRKVDWNPIDEAIGDVHIRSVGVYHDSMEGMERGKNAVFIIDVDGLRIVHLGDLGHILSDKDVKRIGPVDVLMIPVGGVYTLNGSEAKRVVAPLKPRLATLPMHYGTKTFSDLLPIDEFIEDEKNVRTPGSSKFTVDSDAHPAAPETVIMDWKD